MGGVSNMEERGGNLRYRYEGDPQRPHAKYIYHLSVAGQVHEMQGACASQSLQKGGSLRAQITRLSLYHSKIHPAAMLSFRFMQLLFRYLSEIPTFILVRLLTRCLPMIPPGFPPHLFATPIALWRALLSLAVFLVMLLVYHFHSDCVSWYP